MKLLPISLFVLITALHVSGQSLSVEQVKDSAYTVEVAALPKKNKLHWTTKPDSWDDARVLLIKQKKNLIVLESPHPILQLEMANGKSLYAAPREVKLEGAVNFRDIGGYSTKDGRQVRYGKIYRSADISKLSEPDVSIVRELGIQMVCDLRGQQEAALAPDKLPEGTGYLLLPAGSENIGGSASYMKYMNTPERADSLMRSFYSKTDHLTKKYKPMFDQLIVLKKDDALLFHCTAGKDRTGVGAALVLYALGVDEAIIYKDYEATNEYRKGSNQQFIKMLTAQGISEQAAKSMMAADSTYLKSAMDAITKNYGSVDLFLQNEMGLTADKKALLKSKFLY